MIEMDRFWTCHWAKWCWSPNHRQEFPIPHICISHPKVLLSLEGRQVEHVSTARGWAGVRITSPLPLQTSRTSVPGTMNTPQTKLWRPGIPFPLIQNLLRRIWEAKGDLTIACPSAWWEPSVSASDFCKWVLFHSSWAFPSLGALQFLWKWKCYSLSHVWFFLTPWTVAGKTPLSMARIMEWVAIPFSRGSSQPRDQTQASSIAGEFFTI